MKTLLKTAALAAALAAFPFAVIGVTRSGLDDAVRATIDGLTSIDVPVLVGGRAILDEAHARRLGAAHSLLRLRSPRPPCCR